LPIAQALEMARKQGLDLVEVAATASPPVCRVLDYGKYRYAQERKEREQRKGQKVVNIREMRLRPKIGDHDYEAKVRIVHKLLGEGDKVKIVVMFRGREVTHADLGIKLLQRVVESLKGVAGIEKQPILDGKRLTMVITPLPGHKTDAKEKAEIKEKTEVKEIIETREKVKETQNAKA
jgi:translation initiation factor IF-3